MTEFLAESPDVHRWFRGVFRQRFEEDPDIPPGRAVQMLLFLVSGSADAFFGRDIEVSADAAELVWRAEEI